MPYEFDGEEYGQASAHQWAWGTKLIAELDLKGHEHVLDLGCGDGALTARTAALVPGGKVVGIDASRSMIDAALPKAGKNLHFRVMDINELDFVDRFDVIFSNAALHWIKDHQRLLENVRRALRPGGRIRFNFAGAGNCSYFFQVVREALAQREFTSYFREFEWPWYMPPIDEYRVLVRNSELHEVRVWAENADTYFVNEEAIIRWIDQPSLVPFLAQVPTQHKEAFRQFVVRRMVQETKQDDGRYFETFRRINVSAVKT